MRLGFIIGGDSDHAARSDGGTIAHIGFRVVIAQGGHAGFRVTENCNFAAASLHFRHSIADVVRIDQQISAHVDLGGIADACAHALLLAGIAHAGFRLGKVGRYAGNGAHCHGFGAYVCIALGGDRQAVCVHIRLFRISFHQILRVRGGIQGAEGGERDTHSLLGGGACGAIGVGVHLDDLRIQAALSIAGSDIGFVGCRATGLRLVHFGRQAIDRKGKASFSVCAAHIAGGFAGQRGYNIHSAVHEHIASVIDAGALIGGQSRDRFVRGELYQADVDDGMIGEGVGIDRAVGLDACGGIHLAVAAEGCGNLAAGLRFGSVVVAADCGNLHIARVRGGGIGLHIGIGINFNAVCIQLARAQIHLCGEAAGRICQREHHARIIIGNFIAAIHRSLRSGAAQSLHEELIIGRDRSSGDCGGYIRAHVRLRPVCFCACIGDIDLRAAVGAYLGAGIVARAAIVEARIQIDAQLAGYASAFDGNALLAAHIRNRLICGHLDCGQTEIGAFDFCGGRCRAIGRHIDQAVGLNGSAAQNGGLRLHVGFCIRAVDVDAQAVDLDRNARIGALGGLAAFGLCGGIVDVGHHNAALARRHLGALQIKQRLEFAGRFCKYHVHANAAEADFSLARAVDCAGNGIGIGIAFHADCDLICVHAAFNGSNVARLAAGNHRVRLQIIHRSAEDIAFRQGDGGIIGIFLVILVQLGEYAQHRLAGILAFGICIIAVADINQFAARRCLLHGFQQCNRHICGNLCIIELHLRRMDDRLGIGYAAGIHLHGYAAGCPCANRARSADQCVDARLCIGHGHIRRDVQNLHICRQSGGRHIGGGAGENILRLHRDGVHIDLCILVQVNDGVEFALRICAARHGRTGDGADVQRIDVGLDARVAGAQHGQIAGGFNGVCFDGCGGFAAAIGHGDVRHHAGQCAGARGQARLGGVLILIHGGFIQARDCAHACRFNGAAFDHGLLRVAQNSNRHGGIDAGALRQRQADHLNFCGGLAGGKHADSAFAVQQMDFISIRILLLAGFADDMRDVGSAVIGNCRIDIFDGAACGCDDRVRIGIHFAIRREIELAGLNLCAGEIDQGFVVCAQLHIGDARADGDGAHIHRSEGGFRPRIHIGIHADFSRLNALAQDARHGIGMVDNHDGCAGHAGRAAAGHHQFRLGRAADDAFQLDLIRFHRAFAGFRLVGLNADIGVAFRCNHDHCRGNAGSARAARHVHQINLAGGGMVGRHVQITDIGSGYILSNIGVGMDAIYGNRHAAVHAHCAARDCAGCSDRIKAALRVNVDCGHIGNRCASADGSFDIALRHGRGKGCIHAHRAAHDHAGHGQGVRIGCSRLHIQLLRLFHIAIHISDGVVVQLDYGAHHGNAHDAAVHRNGDHADGAFRNADAALEILGQFIVANRICVCGILIGFGVRYGFDIDIARGFELCALIHTGHNVAIKHRRGYAHAHSRDAAAGDGGIEHFRLHKIIRLDGNILCRFHVHATANDGLYGISGRIAGTILEQIAARVDVGVVLDVDFEIFSAAVRIRIVIVNMAFIEIIADILIGEIGLAFIIAHLDFRALLAVALKHFVQIVHVVSVDIGLIGMEGFSIEFAGLETVSKQIRAILIHLAAGYKHHNGGRNGCKAAARDGQRVGTNIALGVGGYVDIAGGGFKLVLLIIRAAQELDFHGVMHHIHGSDHAFAGDAAASHYAGRAHKLGIIKRRNIDHFGLDCNILPCRGTGRLLGYIHQHSAGNGYIGAAAHADGVVARGFFAEAVCAEFAVRLDIAILLQGGFGGSLIIGNNCHRRNRHAAGCAHSARSVYQQRFALCQQIHIALGHDFAAKVGLHAVLEDQRICAARHANLSADGHIACGQGQIHDFRGQNIHIAGGVNIAVQACVYFIIVYQGAAASRYAGIAAHCEIQINHDVHVAGIRSRAHIAGGANDAVFAHQSGYGFACD